METITPFGAIYFRGSRQIFLACCCRHCVRSVLMRPCISRQVLTSAEEGDQQELINSNLRGFFSCQRTSCIQRLESRGNHKPVKATFLLQFYSLWKKRVPWLGAHRDIQRWEGGGAAQAGTGDGGTSCPESHYLENNLHFSLPWRWRVVILGLITFVCKIQECENALE